MINGEDARSSPTSSPSRPTSCPSARVSPWSRASTDRYSRLSTRPRSRGGRRAAYAPGTMDIAGKSVLVLGGYGLVGQAVARRLIPEAPRRIVLLSLKREEAEEAVSALATEREAVEFAPAWGDIFTLTDLKDRPRQQVFGDSALRTRIIDSLLEPLSEAVASEYFLYQLLTESRPDVIVDCVNTATGIAYQDIFGRAAAPGRCCARRGRASARASRCCSSPTTSRSSSATSRSSTGHDRRRAPTSTSRSAPAAPAAWGSTSPTPTPRSGRRACCCPRARSPAPTRCCSS